MNGGAGSLQSGQRSEKPAARAGRQSQKENSTNVFFASQQSDGERGKRKISLVDNPIHQQLKKPTRPRSRLQSAQRVAAVYLLRRATAQQARAARTGDTR